MGGVQRDNELHPLPLPMGEVAERSEDGEGIPGCKTLSVTFGDSSPKGGAKGRSIGRFTTTYSIFRRSFLLSRPVFLRVDDAVCQHFLRPEL